MVANKTKVRVQILDHGVGDSITHPEQIDAEVTWKEGEAPKWDNLKFNMHTTKLKEINWSLGQYSVQHKNFIGYCKACSVVFFVRNKDKSDTGYPTFEEELFKKVFNSNGEFRELILKEATDV